MASCLNIDTEGYTLYPFVPIATIVPSFLNATVYPKLTVAVVSEYTILLPCCDHVAPVLVQICTEPRLPSSAGTPIAIVLPSEDSDIECPEVPPAADPNIACCTDHVPVFRFQIHTAPSPPVS